MLPHAPGVQMADIPEDSVNLDKEVSKQYLFKRKIHLFGSVYLTETLKDEEVGKHLLFIFLLFFGSR